MFMYVKSKQITQQKLKFRRLLGQLLSYIQPLFGSKYIFPIVIWLCMKLKFRKLCVNPYFAQYFFKDRLIVRVKTDDIRYFIKDWIKEGSTVKHMNDYFLVNTDLDSLYKDLSTMSIMQEAKEIYKADMDYKNTSIYKSYIARLALKKPKIRQHRLLNSEAKIEKYFQNFTDLFRSIKEKGFLPYCGLVSSDIVSQKRNIGVGIDKNGSLFKLPGGQHRFSIVKVTGILYIDVEVRMIHKELLELICKNHNLSYIEGITKIINDLNKASNAKHKS